MHNYTSLPDLPPGYHESQAMRPSTDSFAIELAEFEIEEEFHPQTLFSRAKVATQQFASNINANVGVLKDRFVDPIYVAYVALMRLYNRGIAKLGHPLIVKRVLYVAIMGLVVLLITTSSVFAKNNRGLTGVITNHHEIFKFLASPTAVNLQAMKEDLEYLSLMPHTAGTAGDLALADYVHDVFKQNGLQDVVTKTIGTFLDYPNGTHLSLKVVHKDRAKSFEVKLNEDPSGKGTAEASMEYLAFNPNAIGGSFSTNKLVYANYGRPSDFEAVGPVTDALCLIRYGESHPGAKLEAAFAHCKAVLFFSDDAKHPNAILKHNVAGLLHAPGDVLTPGWESSSDQRLSWELSPSTPKVPSVPISYAQATRLLALLTEGPKFGDRFAGRSGGISDVVFEYDVQPVERALHLIWNVLGHIQGSEQKGKAIFIGAARDAACFGTMSANTGTTVMLQLVAMFRLLHEQYNWTPLRSIYFASWDGTEYNLQGAAEYVEQNSHFLRSTGYAYIDLSDAVTGNELTVDVHPVLREVVREALGLLSWPEGAVRPQGKDFSMGYLNELEKNYLPFNSFAGIPLMELKFKGVAYPENSCADDFAFFEKHGDREMAYHSALVRVLARIAVKLVDTPLIPYNLVEYTREVDALIKDLSLEAEERGQRLNFSHMNAAMRNFERSAHHYHTWANNWKEYLYGQYSIDDPVEVMEPTMLSISRTSWNEHLALFEKGLLLPEGKAARPAYRHTIFGPQSISPANDALNRYTYGGKHRWATFPMIRDAMREGNWKEVQRLLDETASHLTQALVALNG